MKHRIRIILFSLFAFFLFSFPIMGSDFYPESNPADYSPGAIASWTKTYYQGKIASFPYDPAWESTAYLPPVGSAAVGDLFIYYDENDTMENYIYRRMDIGAVATWVRLINNLGKTEDVTIDGTVLHFVNGIYIGKN